MNNTTNQSDTFYGINKDGKFEKLNRLEPTTTMEAEQLFKICWQEEFETLVRIIGALTYGKERWFYQQDDIWYDRESDRYIDTYTLQIKIYEAIKEYTE